MEAQRILVLEGAAGFGLIWSGVRVLGIGVEGDGSKGAKNGNSSPRDNSDSKERTEQNGKRKCLSGNKDLEASGGNGSLSPNSQNRDEGRPSQPLPCGKWNLLANLPGKQIPNVQHFDLLQGDRQLLSASWVP